MWLSLLFGLVGSSIIAGIAYRLHSLSLSGAIAAIGVGTILYMSGSIAWFGTLIVFFITSSSLSRWRKRDKQQTDTIYEKGSRRDAGQVLANGGLAALLSIGYIVLPHEAWWYAFMGVMGTVTADTWATEIGSLSRLEPRSILNLKQVPRGTSGGVSLIGSLAAAIGAGVIGGAAVGFVILDEHVFHSASTGDIRLVADTNVIWIVLLAGFLGAMIDSILGATVQHMRRCSKCGKEVEHTYHCSVPAVHIRGWLWMNNDAVNVISSAAGGGIAVVVWLIG
ncbi:MAG: DUF92 domain-containing protein [Paenibacillaceae bacterium]